MALKFPDKDPDERLDYTVDWSAYKLSTVIYDIISFSSLYIYYDIVLYAPKS